MSIGSTIAFSGSVIEQKTSLFPSTTLGYCLYIASEIN